MKQIILGAVLVCFTISSSGQNSSVSIKNPSPESLDNRWDINNYLWSNIPSSSSDKQILDFDGIENWRNIGRGGEVVSINCNGKYFAYNEYKSWAKDSLVVQSTTGFWRKCFAGAAQGFFSGAGDQYIFQNKDSLCFLKMGDETPHIVPGVVSYKMPLAQKPNWIAYGLRDQTVILQNLLDGMKHSLKDVISYDFEADGRKFVYQVNNPQKELVIYDVITGNESRHSNVKKYKFDAAGKALVLYVTKGASEELQYENISDGYKTMIWFNVDTTINISNYSLDNRGIQLIFTIHENDKNQNSIWYWKKGMDKAIKKLSNQSKGLNEDMAINGDPMFTENGRYITFMIEKKLVEFSKQSDAVQLDVQSYFDKQVLFPRPDYITKKTKTYQPERYKAFVSVEGGPIIVENADERIASYIEPGVSGDIIILTKSGKNMKGDRFWEKGYYTDSNWLVSIKDGSRKFLSKSTNKLPFWFSPKGNYLVYFDMENGGKYYCYDLRTDKKVNISDGVPKGLLRSGLNDGWPVEGTQNEPCGLAFWQENLSGLVVYDKYDLWQLDLTGKKPATNLTKGYGRSHNIIFRLMGSGAYQSVIDPVRQGNGILLGAINENNSDNGFYRLTVGKLPELLYMSACVMERFSGNGFEGMVPIKAADTDIWLVKKQSATEAPNYFLTNDFKNYKRITDVQPQKKYTWLTSELHKYKQLDGTISQGVLYKPENFNPSKKYPVIIAFYTKLSDRLNFFPKPELMSTPATPTWSPNWLVSHGYLVFLPDINFPNGHWGPNTVNSIEGAALYLSRLPFVDGRHMAAVGHSNSGRFGYYLLAHSKIFSAMCIGSGAGGTDMINVSLSGQDETAMLEWAETASIGRGLGDLWQNKKVWLDHSAILNADKISSPLLLFHNKNDGDGVRLAVELFTALRRLEKEIWWLQYDEGGHSLLKSRDMKDFTIRYTQFFDHYLKEAPAPRWMTQGIPETLKGVESRYELDAAGSCALSGKHCAICDAWNKQYKRTPEMLTKPISEWHLDKDIKTELDRKETDRHNNNMKGDAQRIKENNEKLNGTWKGSLY